MKNYRRMHQMTSPLPYVLAVPPGFIDSFVGYRPSSIVVYTHMGQFVVELHKETGGSGYELRNAAVELLTTKLDMKEDESLEFVSQSNTELIVRAYDSLGYEKNCFNSLVTHSATHVRVRLGRQSRRSLALKSTFNHGPWSVTPRCFQLMTGLHDTTRVKGSDLGDCGESGLLFSGKGWGIFYTRHALKKGMVLVFQHMGDLDFKVLFYKSDGFENSQCSSKPESIWAKHRVHDSYFYRELNDSAFYSRGNLKVSSGFAFCNFQWLRWMVKLRTLGGDFNLLYKEIFKNKHPYNCCRRFITGNWDSVLLANEFDNNAKVKFQMDLNMATLRGYEPHHVFGGCTMFAVELIATGEDGGIWPQEEFTDDDDDEDLGGKEWDTGFSKNEWDTGVEVLSHDTSSGHEDSDHEYSPSTSP